MSRICFLSARAFIAVMLFIGLTPTGEAATSYCAGEHCTGTQDFCFVTSSATLLHLTFSVDGGGIDPQGVKVERTSSGQCEIVIHNPRLPSGEVGGVGMPFYGDPPIDFTYDDTGGPQSYGKGKMLMHAENLAFCPQMINLDSGTLQENGARLKSIFSNQSQCTSTQSFDPIPGIWEKRFVVSNPGGLPKQCAGQSEHGKFVCPLPEDMMQPVRITLQTTINLALGGRISNCGQLSKALGEETYSLYGANTAFPLSLTKTIDVTLDAQHCGSSASSSSSSSSSARSSSSSHSSGVTSASSSSVTSSSFASSAVTSTSTSRPANAFTSASSSCDSAPTVDPFFLAKQSVGVETIELKTNGSSTIALGDAISVSAEVLQATDVSQGGFLWAAALPGGSIVSDPRYVLSDLTFTPRRLGRYTVYVARLGGNIAQESFEVFDPSSNLVARQEQLSLLQGDLQPVPEQVYRLLGGEMATNLIPCEEPVARISTSFSSSKSGGNSSRSQSASSVAASSRSSFSSVSASTPPVVNPLSTPLVSPAPSVQVPLVNPMTQPIVSPASSPQSVLQPPLMTPPLYPPMNGPFVPPTMAPLTTMPIGTPLMAPIIHDQPSYFDSSVQKPYSGTSQPSIGSGSTDDAVAPSTSPKAASVSLRSVLPSLLLNSVLPFFLGR